MADTAFDFYHGAKSEDSLKSVTTDDNAYQPQSGGEIDWTDGIYLTSEPDQAVSWSEERKGGSKEFHKIANLDLPHDDYGHMNTLLFLPTNTTAGWQWEGAVQEEEVGENGYKYICRSVVALKMFVGACRNRERPPSIPIEKGDAFDGKMSFNDWEILDAVEAPIWPSGDYEPGSAGPRGHQIFFAKSSGVLNKCTHKEILDMSGK